MPQIGFLSRFKCTKFTPQNQAEKPAAFPLTVQGMVMDFKQMAMKSGDGGE